MRRTDFTDALEQFLEEEEEAARQAMTTPRYLVGLDLGQASDYSALSILEQNGWGAEAEYLCRHLKRWPLHTPYTRIAEEAAAFVNREELQTGGHNILAVDMNGPGAPAVDLLRAHALAAELVPIFSHGGDRVIDADGVKRVPKRELVSKTQIALQEGKLKIAPGLAHAETLRDEMLNYQVKINEATAHDSFGAWRTGTHDDLLFSVMLPLWCATAAPFLPPAGLYCGKVKMKMPQSYFGSNR